MMSSFYESQKFTILCKVNKPICEPPFKLTGELRKLKLDWSTVNLVVKCHLTIRKKTYLIQYAFLLADRLPELPEDTGR